MILDDIVAVKAKKLDTIRREIPLDVQLARINEKQDITRGRFEAALQQPGLSVIAEVKKASPSKGVICEDFHPQHIAEQYEKYGANAISVLTEQDFFHGSNEYLKQVHEAVGIPVLRKDFMIDIWQIYEARLIGAQAILLIAAILTEQQLRDYRELAYSLGLDVLVETHDQDEMKMALDSGADIIGINNRNLKTFEVTLNTTDKLMRFIPSGKTIVSESGIHTGEDAKFVASLGVDAVLVGESLMRADSIEDKMAEIKAAGA